MLSFSKGDVFHVVEDQRDWLLVMQVPEKLGFVPSSHVQRHEGGGPQLPDVTEMSALPAPPALTAHATSEHLHAQKTNSNARIQTAAEAVATSSHEVEGSIKDNDVGNDSNDDSDANVSDDEGAAMLNPGGARPNLVRYLPSQHHRMAVEASRREEQALYSGWDAGMAQMQLTAPAGNRAGYSRGGHQLRSDGTRLDPAELTGWLIKDSDGWYRLWSLRFFVLRSNSLAYYTDTNMACQKGVIDLSKMTHARAEPDFYKSPLTFCLEVFNPPDAGRASNMSEEVFRKKYTRVYHLIPANITERDKWLNALQNHRR
eukprot:m.295429 g.295429  ORF g.295429 m.295429 type:complete len:315 (+) comp22969_c1_seq1:1265-2209(+)